MNSVLQRVHEVKNGASKAILLMVVLCVCLFTKTSYAIAIGDFKPVGDSSGVIILTQLDGAEFLDVTVELSGAPTNYQLEQVAADIVLIRLDDPRLANKKTLISVLVSSPNASARRMFAHNGKELSEAQAQDKLNTASQVKEQRKQAAEKKNNRSESQGNNNTIILPTPRDSNTTAQPPTYTEDGKLVVEINEGNVTIGIAAFELAKSKGLNLLMLPGDDKVLDLRLEKAVSSFEDLYEASNYKVAHVFIDYDRKMVRVVGRGFLGEDAPLQLTEQRKPTLSEIFRQANNEQVSVRSLIQDYADEKGLSLFIQPGDDLMLNKKVEYRSIQSETELARLARSINGMVDVDVQRNLIRIREGSDVK